MLGLTIFRWNPSGNCVISPLSPNGDQHQFSPNDIHTLSRDTVMRIDEMITKVKMHCFNEMHGGRFGEFVCICWGLKG